MSRKLAHIEIIESLSPIPGADFIEVAQVLGWQCVVKKGEFKEGEKIVYVEVDSVVPDKPEFEFLRDRKFRVRTIKLRKQISQGLVLPLSVLGSNADWDHIGKLGQDVTEELGIVKYLTPAERDEIEREENKIRQTKNPIRKFFMRYAWFRKLVLTKRTVSGFPHWIAKTDEERIQNIPGVLEKFKHHQVYVTEKIDYQSVTFTSQVVKRWPWLGKLSPTKFKFIVCSRNYVTNDKGSLYWKIAKMYNIEQILRENPNLTIQGEQGDTKVQGNKYDLTAPCLWVFNIVDHVNNYHYNYREMQRFCLEYGLPIVPLVYDISGKIIDRSLWALGTSVQDIVENSRGKSLLANIPREGIVIRCIEHGKKVFSFKAINPDFLLEYD